MTPPTRRSARDGTARTPGEAQGEGRDPWLARAPLETLPDGARQVAEDPRPHLPAPTRLARVAPPPGGWRGQDVCRNRAGRGVVRGAARKPPHDR